MNIICSRQGPARSHPIVNMDLLLKVKWGKVQPRDGGSQEICGNNTKEALDVEKVLTGTT